MSGRFPSRRLGAFLLAQLIGSGVSISCAAESAPSDGFDKVRKELEATKNARTPAAPPAAGLSSSALPDWQGAATIPPPPSPAGRKIPGRETKPSNWLVEAMSQTNSSLGSSGTEENATRAVGEARLLPEKNGSRSFGPEKAAAGVDIRELKPLAGQPVAPDPFARFLGGWMTPQDYALLKPVAVGESAPRDMSRATGSVAPSLNARTPELSTSIRTNGSGESAKKNVPSPAPRENPYLPALAAPGVASSPALAAPKPPIISPLRPVAAPNLIQPTATTPPPLKPPDFPPLSDDEKYFKQLKRF